MNKKCIIGILIVVLGVLAYLTFVDLPGGILDSKVLYRSLAYGFELKHPLALELNTESPELKQGLDEYNLSKVKFGNIQLSVLKRKNRPGANCLREGDLKMFTDCLLSGSRYSNKKTYEKELGGNKFLFQEYDVADGVVWRSFLDAFYANEDYIFQFSRGVLDSGGAERQELDDILTSFKLLKIKN